MGFALDMFIFFLQGLSMSFAVTRALVKSWQEINLIFNVKQLSLMSVDTVCVYSLLEELCMYHLGQQQKALSLKSSCTTSQANLCRAVPSLPERDILTSTSQNYMKGMT